MTEAVHGSFMPGMTLAFRCAAVVPVAAAAVALFTGRRSGNSRAPVQ